MAFIPWPNGIQLCFDFTSAGQDWQFCLAFKKSSGAVGSADLITVTNGGSQWWGSYLKARLVGDTRLRQCRATDMTVEGGEQFILPVDEAGTAAGIGAPLNVASVVSSATAKRGRSYRGRSYVGGFGTSQVVDGTEMSGAFVSALIAAFAGLQTYMDGFGYDSVVMSRQHNGVVTSPAEANEVIAYTVDSHFDSQRRRLAGRGT